MVLKCIFIIEFIIVINFFLNIFKYIINNIIITNIIIMIVRIIIITMKIIIFMIFYFIISASFSIKYDAKSHKI